MLKNGGGNMAFEKLGQLVQIIKPKEMAFDKDYVDLIKEDKKSVALYQFIVLFIKIVEKISYCYMLNLVLRLFMN